MSMKLNRRQFGGLAASAVSLHVLGDTAFSQAAPVHYMWWGNPERDRRTNAIVDMYKAAGRGDVETETYGWDDYWPKLSTMAAGSSLPDVMHFDYLYLFEWARRGQLEPLDGFFGKEIDISNYDPLQLKSGMVDGKTYGISVGANSMAHAVNEKMLGAAGITLPDSSKWTTDDFVNIGKSAKGKLGEGVYFTENMGWREPRLEAWMRSRGKSLYTAEGKLGFDKQDMIDYFEYWFMMQQEGLTPPADVQAQDTDKLEEGMLTVGRAAIGFLHSNQLVANQKLMKDEIGLVMVPNSGSSPGQYMKPSQFLAMSSASKDKAAAAKFISYFISDKPANEILLIERGVTADAAVRADIMPKLSATEQKIIAYLNLVGTHVGPLPSTPPANAGEIEQKLRPAWEAVAFAKTTAQDGAAQFYDEAVSILSR